MRGHPGSGSRRRLARWSARCRLRSRRAVETCARFARSRDIRDHGGTPITEQCPDLEVTSIVLPSFVHAGDRE
jgi:hypothetical protein